MTAHQLEVYRRSWGGAQMRLTMSGAWMGANWGKAKRMPNLDRVLQRVEKAERGNKPKRPEDWTKQDLKAADNRVMQAAMLMAAAGTATAGEAEGA